MCTWNVLKTVTYIQQKMIGKSQNNQEHACSVWIFQVSVQVY